MERQREIKQHKQPARSQRVHVFTKLRNSNKMRRDSLLRGAGSVAVLFPDPSPVIRRGRIGSRSETANRVAHTWQRAFGTAQK